VAKSATIHAVKVLSDGGSGYRSWIVLALDWIAAHAQRPAVISMSLGGAGQSLSYKDSIDALVSSGIVVVVAAGNDAADACRYSPAFVPSAITVGATDASDARAGYSNYGICLDIFAPGSSIRSASATSDTATRIASGTSMACPHVSGAAALLLGKDPTATAEWVRENLISAATPDVVDDVRTGSPNLLLFTPAADDGAPAPSPPPATTTVLTTSTTTRELMPATTTATAFPETTATTTTFLGGHVCQCQCICECETAEDSELLAAEINLRGSDSGSISGGEGSIIAGVGTAAGIGALLAMSCTGYLAGRRAGVVATARSAPERE